MVFLDHGQNLHIHAVRANILMSFSVDFRFDRLIWPVCVVTVGFRKMQMAVPSTPHGGATMPPFNNGREELAHFMAANKGVLTRVLQDDLLH